ncbi:hypothetical protein FKM82_017403 [Ascaphus truei]
MVKSVSPYLWFWKDQRAGIWVACSQGTGMNAWPFPALSEQPDGVWANVKIGEFPHSRQWRRFPIERLWRRNPLTSTAESLH